MKNINIVIIKNELKDGDRIINFAIQHLMKINPHFCSNTIQYKRNICINIISFLFLSYNINILLIVTNLIYFLQNFCKIILLYIHNPYKNYSISYLQKILPVYSILIPLYKEVGNIKIITEGIVDIMYPQYSLDIIILVEENDLETIKELYATHISFPVRIILIPYFLPQTKPKALNYGYYFTKGAFITIYDAEDKPDKDQLLKALQEFNRLPNEYICLQAKLNFYNQDENILTKFFSIEYFHWFNCLLSGLEKLGLPISLGGTSNHFKSDRLKEIGLWDSYNVTEDADLGIRIYMYGYKTKLLDSYTLEESPIEIISWLFQRARWIKGNLQTIMVYMRVSILVANKMNIRSHLSILIFLICGTCSFYILPIIILITIIYPEEIFIDLWKYNIFLSLIYLYVTAIYSLFNSSKRIFSLMNFIALISFPLYFILHSIAAYLALIQLIINPFKWNKTKHGVTKC
jgi:cellulose synthase/poly-beta-1,6-N-acetylglucosamine synthase-like glycosyltransferase